MAHLQTFGDMVNRVARRVGASHEDDLDVIEGYALEALRDVYRRFKWPERRRRVHLMTSAAEDMVIDAASKGDAVVTASAVTTDHVGWFLTQGWGKPPYEIEEVAPPLVTLVRPWAEDDIAAPITGKIYNDLVELPEECAEVITDDLALMDESGAPLGWKDRLTGRSESPYPTRVGRPSWLAYADHKIADTGAIAARRLRAGPGAPDKAYALRVGYYRHYPAPSSMNDALLLPEGLRDIAVWGALYRAYSEPPWVNEANYGQMKQLYEVELDIAIRTEGAEGDAEMFVIDRFDEGSAW